MKQRKLLAMFLAICMMITAIPMQVMAVGVEPSSTQAQWIWLSGQENNVENTWLAFRKEVTIESEVTEPVFAKISADSKYWLYINDEMVVFEGQLKRGPTREDTYFDNVDISEYLKTGTNTISALVWYFGKSGYSHVDSKQGGFLFDAEGESFAIKSDESWKVKKYEAYEKASAVPNYRLSEPNIKYDAQVEAEMIGWEKAGFDDEAWVNATEFGAEGIAPWNNLRERPIPMWKNDGIVLFDLNDAVISKSAESSVIKYFDHDFYVVETRMAVTNASCGIVFGASSTNDLFMWQIGVANGSAVLTPHIKNNGNWDVRTAIALNDVYAGMPSDQVVDMKIVVDGNNIKAYIKKATDASYLDTAVSEITSPKSKKGTYGFRVNGAEAGIIKSMKVTNLDGSQTYLEEDFSGKLNFSASQLINNELIVNASKNEFSFYGDVKESKVYACDLPTNIQYTPYIKVNSQAPGKLIDLWTNTTYQTEVAACAQYVTKAGEQAYESLGWMNGFIAYFQIPTDVEVLELGYRHTGYDSEITGSFESDDEFYNILWKKSVDTLLVTMRDNYMDCPDRERAQWWGDAVNEIQMSFYALDSNANMLAKKGIHNVIDWQTKDGVIPTVAPSGDHTELPAQVLAGIAGYYTYYEYTGDESILEYTYAPAVKYLDLFNMGANGVVEHRNGSWNWSDWGDHSDQKLVTNAWYYFALSNTIKIGELLGETKDMPKLIARKVSLEENFDKVFWNEAGGFYRSADIGITDDRGNALAVCSGLASEDKYEQINEVFKTQKYASPYMEKYVLEAIFQMGYDKDAFARMKDRYTEMVESEIPTLWEFWYTLNGSINHAWTGGPLTMLSMYATGVAPITPAYDRFSVIPQMGTLKSIETRVPSIKGNIDVKLESSETSFDMQVEFPENTTALIGVPRFEDKATEISLNNSVIWQDGKVIENADAIYVSNDEKYVYFEVEPGNWNFNAKVFGVSDKEKYTLNITNPINGKVLVNGDEVSLPYSQEFNKDTSVTLTGVANEGYIFEGFSGTLVAKDEMEFAMGKDIYVEASFAKADQNEYSKLNISTNLDNDIMVDVNGSISSLPYSGYFKADSEVSVNVYSKYPDEHKFVSWTGVDETSNKVNFIISGDMDIRAEFESIVGENLAYRKTVESKTNILNSPPAWAASNLTDGLRDSNSSSRGYTTNTYGSRDISATPNIIDIDLGSVKEFNKVMIYPRTDAKAGENLTCNFPENFTIEVSSDATNFEVVKVVVGQVNPQMLRQVYDLDNVEARYVRIKTTYLGLPADDEGLANPFRLQLAEIEVYNAVKEIKDSTLTAEIIDGKLEGVYTNNDSVDKEVILIAAAYNADGLLLKAEEKKVVIEKNSYDSISMDIDGNGMIFKVFASDYGYAPIIENAYTAIAN